MADVFISYAREDQDFVRRLQEALEERNRNTWVDWKDIPLTAKWKEEVFSAIDTSDSFAAVISPDFIVSKPCREELDHAAHNNKRMVPLWHRDVADEEVPPELSAHQYVFLREEDDFQDAFERLLEALDMDLEWVRFHTRLLGETKEWEKGGRDPSFLLRGKTLEEAESWQAKEADKEPKLTTEQKEYVLASRRAESKRHRRLLVSGALVLMVVMVLGLTALVTGGAAVWNAQKAEKQAEIALSRQLTAQASALRESQADASLLLNVEALQAAPPGKAKEEARFTLLDTLAQPHHISTQLAGHTDWVNDVAFSPDGKLLASASDDAAVRLWDVPSGEPHGQPLTHTNLVIAVAFAPDGKLLATANADNTVRLWDVATGKPHGQPLYGHTKVVNGVAFSPDGKLLASAGGDGEVRLWDVASGKPHGDPLTGHTKGVRGVDFSPDGKLLASASADKTVRLWDMPSGEPHGQPLEGHTRGVNGVTFAPDGKLLASASADKTVRLWDVESRQPVGDPLYGHTNWVSDVAFGPEDGKLLASSGLDNTVRLWDVESRRPVGDPLTGHTNWVRGVDFSPDGKLLASASYDRSVRLWDVASEELYGQPLEGHNNLVIWAEAFGPEDGKLLATGDADNNVRLWDMPSGKPHGGPLTGHTKPVYDVAFSPDGKLLASASADKTVRLWDMPSGEPHGQPLEGHKYPVVNVAFSPDGKQLASVGGGGTVRLWDVASDKPESEPLTGQSYPVNWVDFSPDGKLLATGDADNNVRLWDVPSGEPHGQPLEGHKYLVTDVAFGPEDGKLLASASADNTVRLWDVATGKPHGQPLTGHTDWVYDVDLSPDGELLASASADNTVRLWDVATGKPRGRLLTGHTNGVKRVDFSPDGKQLASVGGGGTVRLWAIGDEALRSEACRIANRNLSEDEWSSFAGAEFDYERTCPDLPAGPSLSAGYGAEGLTGSLSRGVNVADVFEPAFQFEAGKEWESVPPETIDQVWLTTGPNGGSLPFTNPLYYVYDPSNPGEAKEVPAPKNVSEWVSWFQRHPNLETSEPVPVSVGGASGMRIDVRAPSKPEKYPREICGPEPCVPLYPTSGGPIIATSSSKGMDRYVIVDVGGDAVIINVSAPAGKFDTFAPKAKTVLDSVEWKGR